MLQFDLIGRIDEIEEIPTPEALLALIKDLEDQGPQGEATNYPPAYVNELLKMYVPLNLPAGTYMVTGIEGKYYDGYVSGKRLVETPDNNEPPELFPTDPSITTHTIKLEPSVWVEDPSNDEPWPLQVTPNMSVYDIMLAVANSPANGYPDVNHVWFEALVIDGNKLMFSMGS